VRNISALVADKGIDHPAQTISQNNSEHTSFKDRLVQHDIAVKLASQDDGGCTYQHKNLDDGGHFQLASISKDRTQSGNGTKCNDKDHGDKEDANRDFGGFRNRFFVGFIQFVVLDQAGFDALKIF